MNPYWFKPDYQPDPEKPVEFEIKPLDARTAYEALATRYRNALLDPDVQQRIFLRNVTNWRGIDAPCTQENRLAALHVDDTAFGFTVGTWVVWHMDIGRHLMRQATLTEIERKNL